MPADLLETLKYLFPGLGATQGLLSQPTSEFVTKFYYCALEHIGIDVPEPTEEQLIYINNYGKIFNSHISTINLYQVLRKVFDQIGRKFDYSDLIKPQQSPGRNRVFLTLMTDFCLYADCLEGEINEILREEEEKKAIEQKLAEEVRNLEEALEEIRLRREEKNEEIKQNEIVCRSYVDRNEVEQNRLKELCSELAQKQKELNEVQSKLMIREAELHKEENEISKLESQLVKSPEEETLMYENSVKNKEIFVGEIKKLEESLNKLRDKVKSFTELENVQSNLPILIQELYDVHDMFIKHDSEKKVNLEELEKLEQKIEVLDKEMKSFEERQKVLKEKIQLLEKEKRNLLNKLDSEKSQLLQELNSLEIKLEEYRQVNKITEAKIKETEIQINEKILYLKYLNEDIKAKYLHIVKKIKDVYSEEMIVLNTDFNSFLEDIKSSLNHVFSINYDKP